MTKGISELQHSFSQSGVNFNEGIYTRLAKSAGSSSFGEQSIAENVPLYASTFVYKEIPQLHRTNNQLGGSLSFTGGMLEVTSGTNAGGLANLSSARFAKYQPGQGVMARFSAIFDTPTATSFQLIGLSNGENNLGVGYRFGTEFSFVYDHHGILEIQKLTVTTGSATAEDITITLNDIAVTDVSVTASSDTVVTAWEIGEHDWSTIEDIGYEVHAEGADVYFMRLRPDTISGAFSLSGATTAIGTFSQIASGTETTVSGIAQSDFNIDKLDGKGPSGITLDPTKLNVFQIQFTYLGGGPLELYMKNPTTAMLVPVHIIGYSNTNIQPSLSDPGMAFTISAFSSIPSDSVTVKTASVGLFTQGPREFIGPQYGGSNTVLTVPTSFVPIISLKGRGVFADHPNFVEAILEVISYAVEGTKPVELAIVLDGVLSNDANFQEADSNSAFTIDTSATSITGGTEKIGFTVSKVGDNVLNIANLNIYANRYRTITLVARLSAAGTSDVSGSFGWSENI